MMNRWLSACTAGVLVAAAFPVLTAPLASASDEASANVSSHREKPLVVAQATPRSAEAGQSDTVSLVSAARGEGQVTFYFALSEKIAKRISDAFAKRYAVKAQFIRLVTAQMQQRYFAEAVAGNIAADLLFTAGTPAAYAEDGVKNGWVEPVSKAGLPVITSGRFPAKFNKGVSAVVQIVPWGIAYNVEKLKGADIPGTWTDLLTPKLTGQLITADPRTGPVYAGFWNFIEEKYGDNFLSRFNALNPRLASGGVPALQALAAGEGSIAFPLIVPLIVDLKEKGAPLAYVVPATNTGVETHVIMTSPAKAKHPNAAKLFANYVLSPEGNRVFNDDPGGGSLYDALALPRDYVSPNDAGGPAKLDRFAKRLGFK